MKKIFLTLMVVIAAMAVNAQDIYVGGSLGFWRDNTAHLGDIKTSFSIAPEIGYNLSDNWSLGLILSYDRENFVIGRHSDSEDFRYTQTIGVNPYIRYNFMKAGGLKLFIDGGFEFATIDANYEYDYYDDTYNAWNIGIRPGISYSLNNKFSLVAHMGFLGYQDCDSEISRYIKRGFGLNFNNEVTFGVYYSF